MVHHTMKSRLNNLASVREWVHDRKREELDKKGMRALLRKTMIHLGCTRRKALEYIDLILGEEEE